jgi:hypothetical protein
MVLSAFGIDQRARQDVKDDLNSLPYFVFVILGIIE